MTRGLPGRQRRARQRGSSKFEFALAAALFALLVGVGVDRLADYQETAQTVASEQLIATLRSALALRMSQLTASGQRPDVDAIGAENPLGWLSEKPPNYLGELYAPDRQKLAPGNWYFDRRDNTLVYLLNRKKNLSIREATLLKFKVESAHLPFSPQHPAQSAVPANVALVQVFESAGVGGQ